MPASIQQPAGQMPQIPFFQLTVFSELITTGIDPG
jgi:hypothetical protein